MKRYVNNGNVVDKKVRYFRFILLFRLTNRLLNIHREYREYCSERQDAYAVGKYNYIRVRYTFGYSYLSDTEKCSEMYFELSYDSERKSAHHYIDVIHLRNSIKKLMQITRYFI